MHQVIKAYLKDFIKEFEYENYKESVQFEMFVNYCVISKHYPEQFDVESITTFEGEEGIDGVAVIIDDDLVLTEEEAASIFNDMPARKRCNVEYIFIQSKRSEKFDQGEILKFGTAVHDLYENNDFCNNELLEEVRDIHDVVLDNLNKVKNGRPDIILYYATTGTWNEESGLRRKTKSIEKKITETGYFNEVSFKPLDRESIVEFWNYTLIPDTATIPIKSFINLPYMNSIQKSYMCLAPAKDFVSAALFDDKGMIRVSVFEQNVRAYLGDDNLVNQKIRETLYNSNYFDKLALLNNGITMVAQDVDISNERVAVTDYQIVNGCQTSHVLCRNYDIITNDSYIPIKLIQAEDSEVIAKIVESNNSQTQVDESQFLSTKPYLRRIERYFNSCASENSDENKIYFERRVKQYSGSNIGKKRIFDIFRLGRSFAAMFLDIPHLSLRYPSQILKDRYNELYNSNHRELAYYTSALTLYRLELSLNNHLPKGYHKFKWHILMAYKYLICGFNIPNINSKKLDSYCNTMLEKVNVGGKSSAYPFFDVIELIDNLVDSTGNISKDRLKRKAFTTDLINEIKNQN